MSHPASLDVICSRFLPPLRIERLANSICRSEQVMGAEMRLGSESCPVLRLHHFHKYNENSVNNVMQNSGVEQGSETGTQIKFAIISRKKPQ